MALSAHGYDLTIAVEIEPDAATAYRWERQGGGMLLADMKTEDFVLSVEAALERRYANGALQVSGTVSLTYEELYP